MGGAATCDRLTLETMTLEQSGRVLTARYSDPPMSLVTVAFIRDLERLTRAVDSDRTVGAVVLTGVGERFLTHADPSALGSLVEYPHPPLSMRAVEPGVRALNALLRLPGLASWLDRHGGALGQGLVWGYRWKRSILRMNRSSAVYLAAINGPAMAGGLEIALACDLRFAADADHVRLGQFEAVVGLIPGGGGTQRLSRMLGTARALEHVLEGRPLAPLEALELGLVHGLLPSDDLLAETQRTARRLAARSPVAVRAIKRLVYFGADRRFSRALDQELAGFLAAGSVRQGRATLTAFMDDLDRLGETPLLAEPGPWLAGTRVDQTG